MNIIVITKPEFVPGEYSLINGLFEAGLERLHLRKPGSTAGECAALLRAVCPQYHPRIVLHDHYALSSEFQIGGIHLNSRNSVPNELPDDETASLMQFQNLRKGKAAQLIISRSCHSLSETVRWRENCDYLFLSPVFDSISKQGYHSAFSTEELCKARDRGLIDSKIIALGGITAERIPRIRELGFGGAALLGAVWNSPSPVGTLSEILKKR